MSCLRSFLISWPSCFFTKEDVGGFGVNYSFAAFNSYQSGTELISVPYPNTELNIETTTFRDKLKPVQDETWSFKIKGPQGDQVSAELLASMYDASLDQFKPHTWSFNPINKPTYYSYNRSNANASFGTQYFRVYTDLTNSNYSQQQYDQLKWFGFYFGYNNSIRIRGAASISKALRGQVAGIAIEEDMETIAFAKVSDNASLDEVVVVGYGEMNNGNLNAPPPPLKDKEKRIKELEKNY